MAQPALGLAEGVGEASYGGTLLVSSARSEDLDDMVALVHSES